MRVPGGAPPAWVWGVRGRALSHPRLPALWAGCRGPLPTGCGCGVMRGWGPVTNPTARALASWLCALWGWHEGARGGRLLPGCRASGVRRSPTPDCPPSGRAAGAHYPLAVIAGGCGRGDPSPTPQRALLRTGFARCGGGMRVPGGAPPALVWGVRGRALSHLRLSALWAGCRGPLPTGCGCEGVRAWFLEFVRNFFGISLFLEFFLEFCFEFFGIFFEFFWNFFGISICKFENWRKFQKRNSKKNSKKIPKTPARAVAGWCRYQYRAIHVRTPPDIHPAECREKDRRGKTVAMAG